MSAVVRERVTSRRRRRVSGSASYAELLYTVAGESDEEAVEDALLAAAPGVYNGLPLYEIEIEPISDTIWNAVCTYQPASSSPPRPDEEGTSRESFEIRGESKHLTHALRTRHAYVRDVPGDRRASDFGGAINVQDHEGTPKILGTDILFPVFGFTVQEVRAASFITTARKERMRSLVGTMNQARFRDFAAGEVLFAGVTGAQRPDTRWDLTYHFAVSENDRFRLEGFAPLIEKLGWDYLWVRSSETVVAASGSRPAYLGVQILAAYVEKVYKEADFDDLEMLS